MDVGQLRMNVNAFAGTIKAMSATLASNDDELYADVKEVLAKEL